MTDFGSLAATLCRDCAMQESRTGGIAMPHTRIAEKIIECAEKNDVSLTRMRWGVAHNILLGLGRDPAQDVELARHLEEIWDSILLGAVEQTVQRAAECLTELAES
jgi:hypothetical protein